MRILFVTTQYLPWIGGAEIALARQAAALQQRGHEVKVVTLRMRRAWPRHEVIDGIEIERIGGFHYKGALRLKYGMLWVMWLRAFLVLLPQLRRADVVHCTMIAPLSALAAWLARWQRRPVVLSVVTAGPEDSAAWQAYSGAHRLLAGPLDPAAPYLQVPQAEWKLDNIAYLHREYPRLYRGMVRALQRPHVAVTALTASMKRHLIARGFDPARITIIPNSVDPAKFAKPQVAHAVPVAICVARHSFEKGIDILLQAWRLVNERLPQARLILIGNGAIHQQLREMAAQLGIASSVEFRGATTAVAEALAEADVFVMPSRWEGFGIALIEAMAASLPCVATRVGVAAELGDDAEATGVCVVDDYEALAGGIVAILTNLTYGRELGERARLLVSAHYAENVVIQQFEALCQGLVAHALHDDTHQ